MSKRKIWFNSKQSAMKTYTYNLTNINSISIKIEAENDYCADRLFKRITDFSTLDSLLYGDDDKYIKENMNNQSAKLIDVKKTEFEVITNLLKVE